MNLLPVFLKLRGRACLVVGAGEVASGKIESLVAAEARVTVIAPWARPEIARLAADGRILWHRRAFADADIEGQFVVVAGTDTAKVNQHVYRLCDAAGILCNAVDDPPHCDFYYGSVVTRGELQIAISTTGQSPAVAQRLRREIDAQLPRDMGPWLHELGALRREVLAAHPAGEPRKLLLHTLGERSVCGSAHCASRQVAYSAHTAPPPGRVALVGAGPGDPDLLTLKAARLLAAADLILHDDLVPQPVLALAGPSADVRNVGKRCGRAGITQAQIHELMISEFRAGRAVVRLKSGDPLIFGRAGEEMDALRAADVPFEIVPGVTAASAAAAALPCSLTDRRSASSVLLTTAHHAPEEDTHTEPTRIIYMPGRDLSAVAATLTRERLAPDTPCVIVSHAGRVEQVAVHTTLDQLEKTPRMPAPSVLMVGEVFRRDPSGDAAQHQPAVAALEPAMAAQAWRIPPSPLESGSLL